MDWFPLTDKIMERNPGTRRKMPWQLRAKEEREALSNGTLPARRWFPTIQLFPILKGMESDLTSGTQPKPSWMRLLNLLQRREEDTLEGASGRRKGVEATRSGSLLPQETLDAIKHFGIAIKGPSDDTGRGRFSVPQCVASTGAGSVRLCKTGPAFPERPVPHGPSRARGYRHFPGEHGRCLCGAGMGSGIPRGKGNHRLSESPCASLRKPARIPPKRHRNKAHEPEKHPAPRSAWPFVMPLKRA